MSDIIVCDALKIGYDITLRLLPVYYIFDVFNQAYRPFVDRNETLSSTRHLKYITGQDVIGNTRSCDKTLTDDISGNVQAHHCPMQLVLSVRWVVLKGVVASSRAS